MIKSHPFGINQTILDLKGFNEGELVANGGTIEAWAHGADESYGDAGGGGDVYYIEQNCAGSGTCIVHREWEYTGTQERDCLVIQVQQFQRKTITITRILVVKVHPVLLLVIETSMSPLVYLILAVIATVTKE